MAFIVLAAQARGSWRQGQEQGAVARAAATQLLAELTGRPALHPLLASSGAAAALAVQGAQLARCPASGLLVP